MTAMSAYDNDHRVQRHPDGGWIVTDYRTEWWVVQAVDGWAAFDANGSLVPGLVGKASMDDAIRPLIGEPR